MYILSSFIHLLGVSILSHILSRRLPGNVPLRQSSWPRICVLIVFVDSYAFLFTAGILTLGVGVDDHHATCSRIVYLCIFFYGSSKLFVYWFLAERIYIVWKPFPNAKRLQSKVYIFCLTFVLVGYVIVLGFCFYYASFILTDVGVCKVVLKRSAAITVLSFDLLINVLLTSLFIWPLARFSFCETQIKRLATRTLWAALVTLATSSANMALAAIIGDTQVSWICSGSCGVNVLVSAIVLFWVTDTMSESNDESSIATSHFLHFISPTDGSQPPPAAPASVTSAQIETGDLEGGKTLPKNTSRTSLALTMSVA